MLVTYLLFCFSNALFPHLISLFLYPGLCWSLGEQNREGTEQLGWILKLNKKNTQRLARSDIFYSSGACTAKGKLRGLTLQLSAQLQLLLLQPSYSPLVRLYLQAVLQVALHILVFGYTAGLHHPP